LESVEIKGTGAIKVENTQEHDKHQFLMVKQETN